VRTCVRACVRAGVWTCWPVGELVGVRISVCACVKSLSVRTCVRACGWACVRVGVKCLEQAA